MVRDNLGSIVSVVDIGSNSIKFLKVNIQREVPEAGVFSILDSGSYVTRLSENTALTQAFSKGALERAESALRKIFEKICNSNAIYILATESARKVKDPSPLINLVKLIFNRPLEILTGHQEARLSALGARAAAKMFSSQAGISANPNVQFIEIGGGSSQIGMIQNNTFDAISIPWGAVTMFESFPELQMPHRLDTWERTQENFKSVLSQKNFMVQLSALKARIQKQDNSAVVRIGIGGTLINTAKGFLRTGNQTESLIKETEWGISWPLELFKVQCLHFSSMSVDERLKIKGIDIGRADIMPAGLFLFFFLTECLEMPGNFLFTPWGLRYGKIQELLGS